MRILVIGGRGHLGETIVAAGRAAGHEVHTGGRGAANDRRIDLHAPESFRVLDDYALTINASDTVSAPPDALVADCVAKGRALVETGADPVYYRRQLAAVPEGPGRVLLGAGVFPGLSNLLAVHVLQAGGGQGVELAIRWSPFSGGGGGMVRLATHLLDVPTQRWVEGQRQASAQVEAGPEFDFVHGRAGSLSVAFTEPDLLAFSTGAPRLATYGSFEPNFIMSSFVHMPGWLLRARVMRWLMTVQFTVLRRVLLRNRKSRVQLTARALDADGQPGRWLGFAHPDGIGLGGVASVLMGEALVAAPEGVGALCTPDQVLDLARALDELDARGHRLQLAGDLPSDAHLSDARGPARAS